MSYVDDDDWETDANYDNKLTENEQRWGKDESRNGAIDMRKLIEETEKSDEKMKKDLVETGITGSKGYGGRYGVEKDRMDQSAMGHDYIGKVEKHASQKDYAEGFGGKYGIQTDRVDKSAVGFDYKSQLEKHESQTDHKKGFGGKFGVESDRMDKSAVGFQDQGEKVGTNYAKTKPDISGAKPSNLRSKFENLAVHKEEEAKVLLAQQKQMREEKDRFDREQSAKEQTTGSNEPSQNYKPQRSSVVTGRSDKISDVINVFNAPVPIEEKPAAKQPIKIPKAQTPDIISSAEISIVKEPPRFVEEEPPRFVEDVRQSVEEVRQSVEVVRQSVKASEEIPKVEDVLDVQQVLADVVPHGSSNGKEAIRSGADIEQELIEQLKSENIEEVTEDQFILSPDNPGIIAYAIYDYQAAADDEISFDPGDEITHIEMIDEGWWKGFHQTTVTYGLFPANYVQLKE